MHVLAVIPARFAAQRFPGKPLAMLWGKPMLRHVWERARAASGIDTLVIATDDERIASAARGWGATVEMTSPACASGTDRVAEVARRHPDAAIVLNLQGDEPELDGEAVGRLIAVMRAEPGAAMGTLAHDEAPERMTSGDVVKVGVDSTGFATYFTRAMPAADAPPTDLEGRRQGAMLRHVGVYAFTREFLLTFASWPPGTMEQAERLEQLRAVERGVPIRVVTGVRPFAGIDTPEQLAVLEARGPRR
ncbi:MAG: 3-deoxy-manno-octulosonate cytidylyltransferase [Candidatus Eisenbacteria bacterium]|uniref:3-deoxy-manno-octulosonate cytidylyltransferase n=1 Tax=Eiseniibacteriota bacterium TaxID=2212470 RepID=A0A9D6L3G2_UNCEI|nr:3-deoxy-manno-octulosonate cytidylyltransferase [Candidatus Eisenbacteria bacterium]